jgi:predicted extracellular nuclease
VVVGDYQGTTGLGGFFVQEEDGDADGDPLSSEGIFVFDGSFGVDVAAGDVVRVRGTVTEFFNLTEVTNVLDVVDCGADAVVTATSLTFPVNAVDDLEDLEGMLVDLPQTLYASGNFTQARFGEVDLSIDGPLDNPTNVVAPGDPANALQDMNDRSRIQLDDGSNVQNPLPSPPYLGAGGTLRTGDSLDGLTGVLSFSFDVYEVHPTEVVEFDRVNDRPDTPDVGGELTVASYNVLNYFTTLANQGSVCGPESNQGCRGAFNVFEFDRQRAKLVSAISKLEGDVVGLMEIENHPGDVPTADLVSGINDATAPGTYDYVATGAIGTDAIRQAIIYKPDSVTPVGDFAVLDSSVDPDFDDEKNRPMLVQSFMENATGEVFTVAVNHLKSKGSDCNDVGDPDIGDGQGNCNITRTKAAEAIVDYLAGDPTGVGDTDYLVIGDLNSYAKEDPITVLTGAGLTDLVADFVGTGFADGAYSFNFFSQSGYLDHGLASESLLPRVTGAAFWHVNSDEPSGLDYNDFNQPGLFSPDEFRSSDHDPVVIGLNLVDAMGDKEDVVADLAALLPTGQKNTDKRLGKAIDSVMASLNSAWWTSDQTITNKTVFSDERKAVAQLLLIVDSGVAEAASAQSAIDVLLNADRQLAQIELIAAIGRGGDAGKIAEAEAAMADGAAQFAAGLYEEAVNSYAAAWDAATKA